MYAESIIPVDSDLNQFPHKENTAFNVIEIYLPWILYGFRLICGVTFSTRLD